MIFFFKIDTTKHLYVALNNNNKNLNLNVKSIPHRRDIATKLNTITLPEG